MRTPRIAYLLTAFPTISETFVEGEFRALMARGLPIDLYATRNLIELANPNEKDRDRGLSIGRSPYLFGREVVAACLHFALRRPLKTFGTLFTVALGNLSGPRYLSHAMALFPKCLVFARRMEQANTVHVHGTWAHYPATVAFVIARLLGISFSFSAHASLDVTRDTTFQSRKVRAARFVLTCNDASRRFLVARNPGCAERIRTVYHGVSLADIPEPGSVPRRRPPEIVSVGRLTSEKGFLDLLEACALLRERGVDFRLRIFGRGALRTRIEQETERLGLSDRVVLEGAVPHAEVLQAHAGASVVTLASYLGRTGKLDGLPNVLVESLACGTVVVTTDHPGSRELIQEDRFGLLVPQRDPAGLAGALEVVLRNPERFRELAQRGRKRVLELFDRERNVEVISALFREHLE